MSLSNDEIKQAIGRSQHCQRNWDLEKSIPAEDLELLIVAVTQCPSKQNIAFYKTHFVTNRELIEKIHLATDGFTVSYSPPQTTTNSQVLANLLVVFEEIDVRLNEKSEIYRNFETRDLHEGDAEKANIARHILTTDRLLALGIASGYLNLTANLLGYSTGCCTCFRPNEVQKILNLEREPSLLMGVGFKNSSLNRRVHHLDRSFVFPVKPKQKIEYHIIS